MPHYVIPPSPVAALSIVGEAAKFPVGRIFCIGRNYGAHAIEMGHDPSREPPFFFLKPATALATGRSVKYPVQSSNVHHEVEMVVALRRGGRDIAAGEALDLVYGYGVGIDLTRRDLQDEAKRLSRPWEVSKAFDASAPCGPLSPAANVGNPSAGRITLAVNGEVRQDGDLNQMIWKTADLISILSRYSSCTLATLS